MSLRVSLLCLVLGFSLLPVCAQSTASYDSLVQEGNRQLQKGNSTEALASGTRAIALDHARWQAYALSGGALMNLKRYEDAADSFSKAIEFAPVDKQPSLRDLRKQCVLAQSNPVPAAAVPVPPSSSPTQAEVVLWKSIENSTSQTDFQVYLQQYPNGTFAGLAHSHLDQLQAEDKALQERQAAEKARQASEAQRDPIALLKEGKYDAALAVADAAINADPSSPEAYYDKASILITKASVNPKTGKIVAPPGCEEAYQKYLLLSPNGVHALDVRNILVGLGAKVGRSAK